MKQIFVLMLAVSSLGVLAADDAAMQRCRDINDAVSRLACYDAIALFASPSASTSHSAATSFGLESRPSSTTPPSIAVVESTINGLFEGWLPNGQLKLANGQIWEVADGTQAAYALKNPKVRITRGVSGSFFMAIEGVAQTPRVRRIK